MVMRQECLASLVEKPVAQVSVSEEGLPAARARPAHAGALPSPPVLSTSLALTREPPALAVPPPGERSLGDVALLTPHWNPGWTAPA